MAQIRHGPVRIRPYQPTDAASTRDLFQTTVYRINVADYTPTQIEAWAERPVSVVAWHESLMVHTTMVAVDAAGAILGFADMAADGYLDRLFISYLHQRQGYASALLEALERTVPSSRYYTYASITALPFFEAHGFVVLRPNIATIGEIEFRNYLMEKAK